MTIQSVSKFDAATRQLRVAIRLYFQDAEPLGVHTIAGAAHGLLRDLLGRRDGPVSGYARAGMVQPDHVAFVTKMVDDAKNFLKHADRDPESVLSFNTDWTDFLLYDAIAMHVRLARELTRENIIFLLWVTAKYPKVLLLEKLAADGIDELRRVFPKLGAVDAQKRTFLAALNNESPQVRGAE
jgi:hypothetical protein